MGLRQGAFVFCLLYCVFWIYGPGPNGQGSSNPPVYRSYFAGPKCALFHSFLTGASFVLFFVWAHPRSQTEPINNKTVPARIDFLDDLKKNRTERIEAKLSKRSKCQSAT